MTPARLQAPLPPVPAPALAPKVEGQHAAAWVLGIARAAFAAALALLLMPVLDHFALDAQLYGLLVPLGSFSNRLEATDMAAQPWTAIRGFADVIGVIAAVVWLAHQRERRAVTTNTTPTAVVARGA